MCCGRDESLLKVIATHGVLILILQCSDLRLQESDGGRNVAVNLSWGKRAGVEVLLVGLTFALATPARHIGRGDFRPEAVRNGLEGNLRSLPHLCAELVSKSV